MILAMSPWALNGCSWACLIKSFVSSDGPHNFHEFYSCPVAHSVRLYIKASQISTFGNYSKLYLNRSTKDKYCGNWNITEVKSISISMINSSKKYLSICKLLTSSKFSEWAPDNKSSTFSMFNWEVETLRFQRPSSRSTVKILFSSGTLASWQERDPV